MRLAGRFLNVLAAGAVLVGIWYPVWSHFHVSFKQVSDQEISQLKSIPEDPLLDRLARMETTFALGLDAGAAINVAGQLARGDIIMPSIGAAGRYTLPFDGRDYTAVPEPFKLRFASLYVPLVMLVAYENSGDEAHLELARQIILGWAAHDRSTRLPNGLQFNDHAIASRAYVLTRFWSHYRQHPAFDQADARAILEAVVRTAQFLAKPGHYMAATNHGIMQDLALLHIASAFPALQDAQTYRDIALDRLRKHLPYYVSDEGMVLEHSAGYHEYGINLLADYASYLAILDEPLPAELADAYARSLDFYAALRRGDGTLPKIGDTMGPVETVREVSIDSGGVSLPRAWTLPGGEPRSRVLPVSGIASLWRSAPAWDAGQLAMTWSRFPSLAHKHADDLGITLWTSEGNWIDGVGYWPYWSPRRADAVSWPLSNAPHFRGESARSVTRSALLGSSVDEQFAFLDVERQAGPANSVRRQVIWLPDGGVIVVDGATSAGPEPARDLLVVWSAVPGLTVRPLAADGHFVFERDHPLVMRLAVSSQRALAVQALHGSQDPFRGWTSVADVATPVPAVEVSANNADWILSQFSFSGAAVDEDAGAWEMLTFDSATEWELGLESDQPLRLRRQGMRLMVDQGDGGVRTVQIDAPGNVADGRDAIVESYERAMELFPRFRPLLDYRVYSSVFIVAAALVLELLFLLAGRRFGSRLWVARAAVLAGWIGLYFFLSAVYLV